MFFPAVAKAATLAAFVAANTLSPAVARSLPGQHASTTTVINAPTTTTSSRHEMRHEQAWLTSDMAQDLSDTLSQNAEWIMTLGLRKNNVTGTHDTCKDSIFQNGNLARILLSAHIIGMGDGKYLDEALAWCDTLVSLLNPIKTSTGLDGGYWGTGYGTEPGHGEVYIADTGTAVTTLALCSHMGSDDQAEKYNEAMTKFANFVTDGCVTPPPQRGDTCPPKGTGWVLDDGSLGDGYYVGSINLTPYTISTATSGGVFFTEFNAIKQNDEYAKIATNAVSWIINSIPANGSVPYILTPQKGQHYVYQATSYSTEALVDGYNRRPEQRSQIAEGLKNTIKWLVETQNDYGMWGDATTPVGGENQRSPRAASLLQWYSMNVDPSDTGVTNALKNFVAGITDPKNLATIGVNDWSLVTGFVGLVAADLIQPWVTFLPTN